MNTPPGYGAPQQPPGYGQPQPSGPIPNSGSYQPPPHQRTGFTRQIFNPAMYKQPGSGSWAAASLALAIIGWVLCLGPITWPLSIIFGLVGMIGNKRGKGLSFAGVLISGLGVGSFIALIASGAYLNFQGESMAEDAGKPVVAAIADFKNDNGRVPNSLTELIEEGYLPETWNEGLDDIDSHVADSVRGRKWTEFLRYKPGGDATWEGASGYIREDDAKASGGIDWDNVLNAEEPGKDAYQSYGLAFIGLDNIWGSTDDAPVNQSPEEPYELSQVWGGDSTTRDIASKRRELQRLQKKLTSKVTDYQTALQNAEEKLGETDAELRTLIRNENLNSLEKVKAHNKGSGLLKLIGRQQKVVLTANRKLKNTRDRLDTIDIQVRMLESEEDMAKLAENPQELAELTTLLEDAEKVLNTGGDLGELDKLDDETAADNWFKENYK